MPNVPVYNPNRVQNSNLPNVKLNPNAPIEAFGGGQAASNASQAMQGLVGTVGAIAKEEKSIADKAAIEEAKSKSIDRFTKLTYGDKENDEVVFFRSKADLLEKIDFYLRNEFLRKKIANNGFLRVHADQHDVVSRIKLVLRWIDEIEKGR